MSATARIENASSPFSEVTTPELLCRCTQRPSDTLAWEEFVRRFHSTIRRSVARVLRLQLENGPGTQVKLPDQLIVELVDGVYRKLVEDRSEALKRIDRNQVESIDDYLLMISITVVRDYLRNRNWRGAPYRSLRSAGS